VLGQADVIACGDKRNFEQSKEALSDSLHFLISTNQATDSETSRNKYMTSTRTRDTVHIHCTSLGVLRIK
jgi:hypothetical protein